MIDPTAMMSATALDAPPRAPGDTSAKAAKEFEAMFLSVMLGQMFSGVSSEPPFGGGYAEDAYRGLLVEEYGKGIADRGGLGLSEAIQRQLLDLQEI